MSLVTAQTLAIGAFNPHIITPEWLVRTGVCMGQPLKFLFEPLNQGLSFSFKEVQWQIDIRRLMVASRSEDCGALVRRVLELLPHTPVRAVGNNFHYVVGKSDWDPSLRPMLGSAADGRLASFGEVEQTRWTCALRKENLRIEAAVAEVETGVAVMFNFHRETRNAEEARSAAGEFSRDRGLSEQMLSRLSGHQA